MRSRQLSDFEGAWAFRREIVETHGGTVLVAGHAVWSPAEGGLICDEHGEMHLPGHAPMRVTRRYLWEADLTVRFADGRFFHRVPGEGGNVSHWCNPDQYDGSYDFSGWPVFVVVWRVLGPRKDYRMQTRYWREPDTGHFGDAEAN